MLRRIAAAAVRHAGRAIFGAPKRLTAYDALLVFCDASGRQAFTSRRNETDAGEVRRIAILTGSPRRSVCFDFDTSGRLLALRVFNDGGFNAAL